MEFFAQFNISIKTNLRFPQASHFKHTVHFTVLQITIHKRTHSYAYLCSQSHTSMPLFSFKMKKKSAPLNSEAKAYKQMRSTQKTS